MAEEKKTETVVETAPVEKVVEPALVEEDLSSLDADEAYAVLLRKATAEEDKTVIVSLLTSMYKLFSETYTRANDLSDQITTLTNQLETARTSNIETLLSSVPMPNVPTKEVVAEVNPYDELIEE